MSDIVTVSKAAEGKLRQVIRVNDIEFFADVMPDSGGDGAAPDPHHLLDAALGACTALTLTMVARRRQIPLTDVRVQITHVEANGEYHLQRDIALEGELSAEQRGYLLGIANKCPIHRVLTGHIDVATTLV